MSTEERKYAILFAATLLSARKLLELDPDKQTMAKQFFVDQRGNKTALCQIEVFRMPTADSVG